MQWAQGDQSFGAQQLTEMQQPRGAKCLQPLSPDLFCFSLPAASPDISLHPGDVCSSGNTQLPWGWLTLVRGHGTPKSSRGQPQQEAEAPGATHPHSDVAWVSVDGTNSL